MNSPYRNVYMTSGVVTPYVIPIYTSISIYLSAENKVDEGGKTEQYTKCPKKTNLCKTTKCS